MNIFEVTDIGNQADREIIQWMQEKGLLKRQVLLGGPGQIVEVDENVMVKKKYICDAHREQSQPWVFGIYDRSRHIGYIQLIDNRDAATLIPIIQAHVQPGTMIYSDGWAAYNDLAQLGYGHEVIGHGQHSVDPATAVHTNGVRAYWSRAKQKIKAVYGSRLHMVPSYLDEFMWRERYGLASADTFDNMLAVLAEHYL